MNKGSNLKSILFIIPILLILTACDNNTELMKQAMSGDVADVKASLDKGTNVNKENNYGWTALMHAARNGHTEVVELLLDHGADVDAKDHSGWTPLMRAAVRNNAGFVAIWRGY